MDNRGREAGKVKTAETSETSAVGDGGDSGDGRDVSGRRWRPRRSGVEESGAGKGEDAQGSEEWGPLSLV